ncbi:MAG: ArsA-related P-loop ATPase [Actinomycetota bacterium]
MPWEDLFARRVVIVSGKGGTGKSTIAAALATAAARDGRRVLLAEIEGRAEVTRTLEVDDPGFEERATPLGFSVLSIVPAQAAVEYLRLFSGLGRVPRAVAGSGALDQVVGGAPGLRDLLICGKLYEIAHLRRANHPRTKGRPVYDLVVVDGPPTGQIIGFISAPDTFAEMVRVGRIRRHASGIAAFLRDHAQVLLTTIPEEMSVAETVEAIPAFRRARIPATVAINRCVPAVSPAGTLQRVRGLRPPDLSGASGEAGLRMTDDLAAGLIDAAADDDARHDRQRAFIRRLGSAGPAFELPDVAGIEGRELVHALAVESPEPAPAKEPSRSSDRPRSARRSTTALRRALSPGIEPFLDDAEVVVVCGSGGVGKTTIAAAIGLHLAPRRARAALLTVDPARRLATALRLPIVPGDRTTLSIGPRDRLEVMQLDTQRTFDELIERHGGTRERKDRILSNRFYRRISDTLAGTHEYMAMEKLYELAEEEDHDALVVDTPPTRSALSFLEAPTRLTDFLGGRVLRWMLRPSIRAGRMTLSAARVGVGAVVRTFGRVLGTEVVSDTVEFLAAFEGMYGGFTERAERVLELLRSSRCAFVVVTAPSGPSLDEAGFFLDRLTEAGMRPAAVVVNRFDLDRRFLPESARRVARRLGARGPADRAAAAVILAGVRRGPRVVAERTALARFVDAHPTTPLVAVPELPGDVHDVKGLRRVAAHLFGAQDPGTRRSDRDRDG